MAAKRPLKKQKNRNSGLLIGLFTMIAAVAAVIFAIAIFFRVGEVRVTGNSLYSRDEVLAATGIEKGDNMLTIRKSTVASQVMVQLPYVAEVRISRALPDRVNIEVHESEAAASIQSDVGDWWLVSSGGKVLEQIDEMDAGLYFQICGAHITAPEIGRPMQCEPSRAEIIQLMEAMENGGMLGLIDRADVSAPYDMILWVENLYEIHVGGVSEIDYKMRYLSAVLEALDGTEAGVIDLTFDVDRVARFIPRSAEQ